MARAPRSTPPRVSTRAKPKPKPAVPAKAAPAVARSPILIWLARFWGGTLVLGLLTLVAALIASPGLLRQGLNLPQTIGQDLAHLASAPGAWLDALLAPDPGPQPAPKPGARSPASGTPATGQVVQPAPLPKGLPNTPGSFAAARKLLYEKVHVDHRTTFYCGCAFDAEHEVSLGSCGLRVLGDQPRALRAEAEHILPAAHFGQARACWRVPEFFAQCHGQDGKILSGRECCLRVDPLFQVAHNDLHNLVPAVGWVNAQRRDYAWGMIPGEARAFGRCNLEVDAALRRVEPPENRMGDIARVLLYMRDTYGFRLSPQDARMFGAWNNQDPPDAWEKTRNRRVKAIQGVGNQYVDAYRKL